MPARHPTAQVVIGIQAMNLCDRCNRAGANFHITRVESSGEVAERHFCEPCAVAEGFVTAVAQSRRSMSRVAWAAGVVVAAAAITTFLGVRYGWMW